MANKIVHNEPPDLSNPNPPPAPPAAAPAQKQQKKLLPDFLDGATCFETDPPPRDFVLPGFMAGTVGALVSPGATGKSWWALEAAIDVSTPGVDLLGLGVQQHGPAIYLSIEDPDTEMWHRLRAIRKHEHLTAEQAQRVATNLRILPLIGRSVDLLENHWLTAFIDLAIGQINPRLIIVDTLSRAHTADENSNGDMARVLNALQKMATETGAAVLFLHHIGKGSARAKEGSDQTAARGASALIDNARWGAYVEKMAPDEAERWSDPAYGGMPIPKDQAGRYMRFGVAKVNYSAPPETRWYKRHEGGVLKPVELVEVSKGNVRSKGVSRETL